MDESDRMDLLRNMGAVYNDVWDDEAVRDRFMSQPRAVLAEHGIELPAAVKVQTKLIEASDAPKGTKDDFFAEWDRMVQQGTLELKVTASRPAGITTTDLSDEQLDRVSGGSRDPWDYAGCGTSTC